MLVSLLFSLAVASDDPAMLSLVEVESALVQVQELHLHALEDEDLDRMMCALPRQRALETLVSDVTLLGKAAPASPAAEAAWSRSLRHKSQEAQELAQEASRCVAGASAPPGGTQIELDCGDQVCRAPREGRVRVRRIERASAR